MRTLMLSWLGFAGLLISGVATAQTTPVSIEVSGSGLVTSQPPVVFCSAVCTVNVPVDTPVTLTVRPIPGNRFVSWGGACAGSGECLLPANTAATISATFEPLPSYTLQVAITGGGVVGSSPGGIFCRDACSADFLASDVALTAGPNTGSEFVRWTGACTGTEPRCTVGLSADSTVNAEFRPIQEPVLTVTGTTGGSLEGRTGLGPALECSGDCSAFASVARGTLVSLFATAEPGFSIARWTGACEGSNTGGGGRRTRYRSGGPRTNCDVRMTGDLQAGVEFEPDPVVINLLTVTTSGQGFVTEIAGRNIGDGATMECPSQCQIEVPDGTTVQLTAMPADGYQLAAWEGACGAGRRAVSRTGAGAGECSVPVVGDTQVTARFVRSDLADGEAPNLRVVVVGEGTVTGPNGSVNINCPGQCEFGGGDDDVERARQRKVISRLRRSGLFLTATPAAGYRLASWENCQVEGETKNCRVGVSVGEETLVVTATFEAVETTPTPEPPTPPVPPVAPPTPTEPGQASPAVLTIIQQLLDD